MNKTGWIILIVCLGLVFCICAGLFIAGRLASSLFANGDSVNTNTKDYKDMKNPYSADGQYSVKMKSLKELEIDWISGSVLVELTDEDVIRIQEKADSTIKEADALRYGVSGDTLRIQACKKNHLNKLPVKVLIVSLPRSLAASMSKLEIDTVSAAVTAGELQLEELDIDTVSGQVDLSAMTAEEASMDSVSGPVSLLGCAFGSLRVDTVSGKVKVVGTTVKKVRSSTVSGPIEFTVDDCKNVRVNTMSGPIVLDLARTPKELKVDTTSGEVRLTLPKDASCTIDLDAMSGKLYMNDEAVASKQITLGEGDASFDIDSMSGSVYVFTK